MHKLLHCAQARRIKAGQQIDTGYLQTLLKRRNYSCIVAVAGVLSLALGVLIAVNSTYNMESAVRARSAVEPGTTALAWRCVAAQLQCCTCLQLCANALVLPYQACYSHCCGLRVP
jgi:hypothetical protein